MCRRGFIRQERYLLFIFKSQQMNTDMIKLLKVSLIALFIASLSGCAAFHSGYITDSTALSQANFSYVDRQVQGYSRATYVFGIGGNARQALVDEAKEKMRLEEPLGDNQAYANITVNWKNSYIIFGIVMTVKCTVTADIVEFNK